MGKCRQPTNIPLCAYCGEQPGTTYDHVVPRCLFGPAEVHGLGKVRACRTCNNTKSQGDAYLRDLLVTDARVGQHPVAQHLLQGPVIRSVVRKHSRIVRPGAVVSPTLPYTPIRTGSGLYLSTLVAVPPDPARYQRVFTMIVRGLYFHTYQRRLPPDHIFTTRRIPPPTPELIEAFEFKGAKRTVLGDNVFGYIHRTMTAADDPEVSDWLFWFYDRYHVVVHTNRPFGLDPTIAAEAARVSAVVPPALYLPW